MEINDRGNYRFYEEVTGPSLYRRMNKLETFSTTGFVLILLNERACFSMTSIEQVRLILSFYGFSKTELARIIGISRPALYAWLDGTSEPAGENHDKLLQLAQFAHDSNPNPAISLFHGYIDRAIPGYEKSLLEYLSGPLDDKVFISALVQKIYRMTGERRDRLATIPKAKYPSELSTLDDNLAYLGNGV